jgi:hypothetical protein
MDHTTVGSLRSLCLLCCNVPQCVRLAASQVAPDRMSSLCDTVACQVMMDDGSIQLCSRTIACIYYLTKHWKQEDGGALVDHGAAGGPQVGHPEPAGQPVEQC